MLLRKLFFKLKRKLFYLSKGFYPEDLQKMVSYQIMMDSLCRDNFFYSDKVKEQFSENECYNKCGCN